MDDNMTAACFMPPATKRVYIDLPYEVDVLLTAKAKELGMTKRGYVSKLILDATQPTKEVKKRGTRKQTKSK